MVSAENTSLKRLSTHFISIILLGSIAWISLFPDDILQGGAKYFIYFLAFAMILLLSLKNCIFSLKSISKSNHFFWLYIILLSFNIWSANSLPLAAASYLNIAIPALLLYLWFKNGAKVLSAEKITAFLCVCATIVAIIGFLEIIYKNNYIYEHLANNYYYRRFIAQGRMMSTQTHPNILGAFLIGCVPLSFYWFQRKNVLFSKLLRGAAFLLILGAALFTFSRGTWIAMLFMASLWLWSLNKKKWILLLWGGFLGFSLLINRPIHGAPIWNRFGFDYFIWALQNNSRVIQYFVTAAMAKAHPLLGIGLGHYRMLFTGYAPTPLDQEVMIPDSIYLMHLAETGLIGFSALMVFIGATFRKAWISYTNGCPDKPFLRALCIGFAGLLINMGTFDGFLWCSTLYLFWIFAALISSYSEHNKKLLSS